MGREAGARLALDGSPWPLFTVQTSGNDAAEEDGLGLLFGVGFVRAVRLSRRRSLRWLGSVWLAGFIARTLVRHAARNGIGSTLAVVQKVRRGREVEPAQDFATGMAAISGANRRRSTVLIEHWEHALGSGRGWPDMPLIATAIDIGDGSRVLFDAASGVSLVGAIAASTCLPGLAAPIQLLGRRFMDGGIVSPANADVAIRHEDVWIVCPTAAVSLDREIAELRSSGSTVHLIQPSEMAREALPPGLGEFDPTRRLAAARAGFADGRAAAAAAAGRDGQSRPPSAAASS